MTPFGSIPRKPTFPTTSPRYGLLPGREVPRRQEGRPIGDDGLRIIRLESLPQPRHTAASYAECGDFDVAVKWQSRAIELLPDEKEKEDYRTRLKLYQEKKPYRRDQ